MQIGGLAAGLLEDPAADRDDEASLFGEWDEAERRNHPALRVHPAQQRLDAVIGARREVDHRLVVNLELLELQSPLELGLQLEPLDDLLVHRRLEYSVAPFAVPLRHVHRNVSVAQELLRVRSPEVVAGEANADACSWIHLVGVDVVRRLEPGEDACGNIGGVRRIGNAVEQDCELVPAEARDRVCRAHGDLEATAHLLENGVAGGVAQAVVHRLEVVEVDEHDADRRPAAERAHDRVLHAVGEKGPVGEIRDGVVERLMRELLLERFPLADVAAVQDDAADVLVLEQIGVLHFELKPGSVAVTEAAFDHVGLGAPAGVRIADTGKYLRQPGAVRLGEYLGELRPFHLVGPISEHSLDGRALIGDLPMRVEHGDEVA